MALCLDDKPGLFEIHNSYRLLVISWVSSPAWTLGRVQQVIVDSSIDNSFMISAKDTLA